MSDLTARVRAKLAEVKHAPACNGGRSTGVHPHLAAYVLPCDCDHAERVADLVRRMIEEGLARSQPSAAALEAGWREFSRIAGTWVQMFGDAEYKPSRGAWDFSVRAAYTTTAAEVITAGWDAALAVPAEKEDRG